MTDGPSAIGAASQMAYICNATGVSIDSVMVGSSVVGQDVAPMTATASAPACSMPGKSFPYPLSPFTLTVSFSNGRTVCQTIQAAPDTMLVMIVALLNGFLVSTAEGTAKELLFTSGAATLMLLHAEGSES